MPHVAFVNRQGGQERRNEVAGADEIIDFDPDDPTVVKVHYDLAAWSFEHRADLSEALAEADVPHAWDGDELVVPEVVEERTDALFERLEERLGPFPIALADDAESTEFRLDEWSDADRTLLTSSLVESEIPHRWEATTVVVARDAEDAVDDLLDAIEEGELLGADESAEGPPDDALSTIYLAADKLARDPLDARSRTSLLDLAPQIDADHPPYAFAPRTWTRAVESVGAIVALIESSSPTGEDEEMADAAGRLRDLLRPYV